MSKKNIIRAMLAEGKTQQEIAKELNICQSSVSYYGSNAVRHKTEMRQYFKYRLKRCIVENEAIVIYKENSQLYMTCESNYKAFIRNRSKLSVLSGFNTFDEVIHYMNKYAKTEGVKFIDKTGGEKV